MSVSEVSSQDGFAIASSIRALALEAHWVLQGSASNREVQDLLGRIEEVEGEALNFGSDELHRWLISLRRVVEEQVLSPI